MIMFKPSPKVVAALREHLDDDAAVDAVLATRKPDLTRLLMRAAAGEVPLGRELLAAVSRAGCALLGERHPGASIEVRVPPFGVIQAVEGPKHTRGTPPNTVEADAHTWLALVTGRLDFEDATRSHAVAASGIRSDVSDLLRLIGQNQRFKAAPRVGHAEQAEVVEILGHRQHVQLTYQSVA